MKLSGFGNSRNLEMKHLSAATRRPFNAPRSMFNAGSSFKPLQPFKRFQSFQSLLAIAVTNKTLSSFIFNLLSPRPVTSGGLLQSLKIFSASSRFKLVGVEAWKHLWFQPGGKGSRIFFQYEGFHPGARNRRRKRSPPVGFGAKLGYDWQQPSQQRPSLSHDAHSLGAPHEKH